MPGFDGTGPRGDGPRTGRGLGKCKDDEVRTDSKAPDDDFPRRRGFGFGAGRGRGRGRGLGWWRR
ncbi:MAG: DUF5320 domain-containing protein [Chlorobi bacterium]|nr:DUF5320 domain-containing protein [Chlorobiota bacterium]